LDISVPSCLKKARKWKFAFDIQIEVLARLITNVPIEVRDAAALFESHSEATLAPTQIEAVNRAAYQGLRFMLQSALALRWLQTRKILISREMI
jgi:hypothetical protein